MIKKHRLIFLLLALLQLTIWKLFFPYGYSGLPVLFNGMSSFSLYCYLFYYEHLDRENIPSPILFFIFSCILFLGLAPITSGLLYSIYEHFNPFIYLGSLITHSQAIGFIYKVNSPATNFYSYKEYYYSGLFLVMLNGYLLLLGYFIGDFFIKPTNKLAKLNYNFIPKELFFSISILYLSLLLLNIPGQIFHLLKAYLPLAIIAIGIINFQKKKESNFIRILYLVIILLTFLQLLFSAIFFNSSKQSIFFAFLPLLICCFYYTKHITNIFLLLLKKWYISLPALLFSLLFILFIFNFVLAKRQNPTVSTNTILIKSIQKTTPGSSSFNKNFTITGSTFYDIPNRLNLAAINTWCYVYPIENGFLEWKFYKRSLQSLIPRYFWPDKPKYSPGQIVENIMLGRDFKDVNSAWALGLSGALYISFGWFSLIFVILFGIILNFAYSIIKDDLLVNPFSLTAYFYLMVGALKSFEACIDGGISFFACYFILLIPCSLFVKFVLKHYFLKN